MHLRLPLVTPCSILVKVYNESIKDLFVEPGRPAALSNKHDVRLDKKGNVYVEGLVECEVHPCNGHACAIMHFQENPARLANGCHAETQHVVHSVQLWASMSSFRTTCPAGMV